MSNRTAPILVAAIMLAVLAFGLWYSHRNPRDIVGTGTIVLPARWAAGTAVTLRTREIDIAGRRFQEVEMANGTWIACSGDCRRAAREAGDEFWDALQSQRR